MTNREAPVFAWWGVGDPQGDREPGDDELVERMVELVQGIDGNDPAALEGALHLTVTHPRLKMPEGYSAGTYQAEFC